MLKKCWKPVQKRGGIRAASEPAMFLLTGIANLLVIVALFYNYTTNSLSCSLQKVNMSATADGSEGFCLNVTGIEKLPWFCCATDSFTDFNGALLIASIVLTFLFIFVWVAWISAKLVYCCRGKDDPA